MSCNCNGGVRQCGTTAAVLGDLGKVEIRTSTRVHQRLIVVHWVRRTVNKYSNLISATTQRSFARGSGLFVGGLDFLIRLQ